MASELIGSVRQLQVDDLVIPVGDAVTIKKNRVTRESYTGAAGDSSYRERWGTASIEFDMLIKEGRVRPGQLEDKTNSTVSVVTPTVIYVLRNARQVGDLSVNATDGIVTVTFEGPEIREM